MKKKDEPVGVAIVGTRERGGIRAVIENHIQAGVYDGYRHYFIASHDEVNLARRLFLAAASLLTLTGLIIRGKVSLCHLHGSMKGSIYRKSVFVFVCRLLKCEVIFHLHGSEFAMTVNNAGAPYRFMVRYVLNHSDYVFVLSDYWKSYVRSISKNPNVRVINNFPSPVFESIFEEKDFSKKPVTEMLFLGHIGQRKGIYDLVDAVDLLRSQSVGNFRVNVAGNGEVEKLRALVASRELNEYFNVIGWVTGEQKHQLLETSDILLLPSHNEGLPIAILEAFSAGLAVLSTRVGGIPDAIDNERFGLLVEPGHPKALAGAIMKYLSSEGLIESVARHARELYRRDYSATVNVERIRSVIRYSA